MRQTAVSGNWVGPPLLWFHGESRPSPLRVLPSVGRQPAPRRQEWQDPDSHWKDEEMIRAIACNSYVSLPMISPIFVIGREERPQDFEARSVSVGGILRMAPPTPPHRVKTDTVEHTMKARFAGLGTMVEITGMTGFLGLCRLLNPIANITGGFSSRWGQGQQIEWCLRYCQICKDEQCVAKNLDL